MRKKEKKKRTVLWVLSRVLLGFVLFIAALALCWAAHYFHRSNPAGVKTYATTNPHILPVTAISAHRSGAGIMPEELMCAFRYCIENPEFDIDYFEFDLHMTADGQLVLLHDATLDRTSDSEEVFGVSGVRASEKTLEELRQLNMGAKFVAEDGSMPYANLSQEELTEDLRIVTIEQVLDYLMANGDFRYIIELKDGGALGMAGADRLYAILAERDLLEKAEICSFKNDVLQYVDQTYPDATRGASKSETIEFIIAALLGKKEYQPSFGAVQLPFGDIRECYGINVGLTQVVNYAHERNIAVQYWTINNEKDMAYLASIGADVIMTDYPNKLAAILR